MAGVSTGPGTEAAVVAALVRLATALRIETVTEGVERPEQAAVLRVLGCTRGQGHLFDRPGAAERPA